MCAQRSSLDWWRLRRVRWWWVWFGALLLLALLLLMMPRTAHAQGSLPTTERQSPQGLSDMHRKAQSLVQRLTERSQQVKDLQAALTKANESGQASAKELLDLSDQLKAARESLSVLQKELTETLSSLDKLSTDYKLLSADWETYRMDSDDVILEVQKERDGERARADRLKLWAVIASVIVGLLGGFLGMHFAGTW